MNSLVVKIDSNNIWIRFRFCFDKHLEDLESRVDWMKLILIKHKLFRHPNEKYFVWKQSLKTEVKEVAIFNEKSIK